MAEKNLGQHAAIILCGGKSSRMGFDKSLMLLPDGRRLIAATAETLAGRFGEVVLACGRPERFKDYPDLASYTLIGDDKPHSGPAGAVATALAALGGRAAFVMAGDMTVVEFPLIESLADLIEAGAEVAVPVHDGRQEPLYAFYAASAGPLLAEAAETGRGTLKEVFPKLRTLFLELSKEESAFGLFRNVNTPVEAEAAGLAPPQASRAGEASLGNDGESRKGVLGESLIGRYGAGLLGRDEGPHLYGDWGEIVGRGEDDRLGKGDDGALGQGEASLLGRFSWGEASLGLAGASAESPAEASGEERCSALARSAEFMGFQGGDDSSGANLDSGSGSISFAGKGQTGIGKGHDGIKNGQAGIGKDQGGTEKDQAGLGSGGLHELLRSIPKVDRVMAMAALSSPELSSLSPEALLAATRAALSERREIIARLGEAGPWDPVEAVAAAASRLAKPSLGLVINATGVILHTNLGRAPMAKAAVESVARTATGYSTLEYDPASGRRRSRQSHVEGLILELFGGEAALVVNNNAAAILLVAAALAYGRPVVISRGELVEIGASFRLGDILEAGGAILREVGSTNRTVAADYDKALEDGAPALVLSVHAGNFRLIGYGGRPEASELVAVAKKRGVPLVCDLGSGSLFDLSPWLPDEPRPRSVLSLGADLVTMSGDKLMGAGQAGIITGCKDLVEAMRIHPMARAARIDKLNLSALEATLRLAKRPKEAMAAIPTLSMLTIDDESLRRKANALLAITGPVAGLVLEAGRVESQVGGGSGPAMNLPSWAVSASMLAGSICELDEAMRGRTPPIVGRVFANRLWLDVRTIDESQFPIVAEALREAALALNPA